MIVRLPLFAGLLMAIIAISSTACKKPTPFGEELLGDEYADLAFTDTITVECSLVREDSLITSDRSGANDYFLCGEVNDPVFGRYSSDLYTLIQAQTLNPQFDTTKQVFDSIVLYLNYASSGVYGDTLSSQTLRVYHLADDLVYDSTYYSNASIAAGEEIGRVENFRPKPSRSDSLYDGIEGAFLRVPLDNSFGKSLMLLDSVVWLSDSAFYRAVKGLKIVATSNGANPGAMLAFNLNNTSLSRISLYYTQKSDTTQKRFDFFFRNTNKFTHFQHEYQGSEAGSKLGQALEDKLYLHGMQGLRLKVTFPYAQNLGKIAVNKAQLVLTVADNNSWLLPADQLIMTEPSGDTAYAYTSDVLYALGNTQASSLRTFGGFPEKELVNGTTVTRYRLALSDKFQQIVDDDTNPDIRNRTVFISVYPRTRSAERCIFYGPKSAPYRAKVELKYTRVE